MTVLNLFLSLSVGSFCCCCKFASSARKSFLSELKRFLSELKRASSVFKRFLFARRRTASSFKCANCFFFFFTKIDRAVLTHHPHPVRHNRSACFITKIFELELPKSENTYRAESTLVISHVCVCLRLCVCVCACVCAFAHVPVGMQMYTTIHASMSFLRASMPPPSHSSRCGASHVLRILLSLHSQVPKHTHGM